MVWCCYNLSTKLSPVILQPHLLIRLLAHSEEPNKQFVKWLTTGFWLSSSLTLLLLSHAKHPPPFNHHLYLLYLKIESWFYPHLTSPTPISPPSPSCLTFLLEEQMGWNSGEGEWWLGLNLTGGQGCYTLCYMPVLFLCPGFTFSLKLGWKTLNGVTKKSLISL